MIGIGSHNQIQAMQPERISSNLQSAEQKKTLHLTRFKYTTQASCIDGKLNLGPKNSVFLLQAQQRAPLCSFILYSFLFAGSVDRDHET